MILIVSIKKAFTFKITIYSIVLSHNNACLSTVFQYTDCGLNCQHSYFLYPDLYAQSCVVQLECSRYLDLSEPMREDHTE